MDNNLNVDENQTTPDQANENVIYGFNRQTRKMYDKLGVKYVIPERKQLVSQNKEFKQYKKKLALTHGSKTGKLKKKHLRRELISPKLTNKGE